MLKLLVKNSVNPFLGKSSLFTHLKTTNKNKDCNNCNCKRQNYFFVEKPQLFELFKVILNFPFKAVLFPI